MRFALLVLALSVLSLSEASDFKQLPLLTRVGDTAGHTFSSSETSLSCLRVAAAPYCHYGEPDGLSIGVIRYVSGIWQLLWHAGSIATSWVTYCSQLTGPAQ